MNSYRPLTNTGRTPLARMPLLFLIPQINVDLEPKSHNRIPHARFQRPSYPLFVSSVILPFNRRSCHYRDGKAVHSVTGGRRNRQSQNRFSVFILSNITRLPPNSTEDPVSNTNPNSSPTIFPTTSPNPSICSIRQFHVLLCVNHCLHGWIIL